MAHFILVQLLVLIFLPFAEAKMDRVHAEGYLGEKKVEGYHERYTPVIAHDIYRGQLNFADEIFFQDYFERFLVPQMGSYSQFLRSELNAGLSCPNLQLSRHFDDIRFSYRLITLSYLLEGQWHLNKISEHFDFKKACDFDIVEWARSCSPRTPDMKKFISGLIKFAPRYQESLPTKYTIQNWLRSFQDKKYQYYSHYRLSQVCGEECDQKSLPAAFKRSCEQNRELMHLICSENDELYGLSSHRHAFYLLGQSNIINTYNQRGEAQGCLRRFAEVLSHKEVSYPPLENLFPAIQSKLREQHQERFLQGRVFFFGAGKEFQQKGLSDLYVKEQPLIVPGTPVEPVKPRPETAEPPPKIVEAPKKKVKVKDPEKPKEIVEIKAPQKSAFLQAAEIRAATDSKRVEVDMLKFKYDYVFSLNMINVLSERLKTFMGREALVEMANYDKLGSKEGPVPLLFIKFMIDMEEHHGLWNLVGVLGNKFYVANEIDAPFKPGPERVELINDKTTEGNWQLYVINPL